MPEKISKIGASLVAQKLLIKSPHLFYDSQGKYLAGLIGNSEIVYISAATIDFYDEKSNEDWEKILKQAKKLNNEIDEAGLSYLNFKAFTATILGESTVGYGVIIKDEIFAFATANDNFKKWYKIKKKKDLSYRKVISLTGEYATISVQYSFLSGICRFIKLNI